MSSTSTGAGFTTSLGTGPSVYDRIVAMEHATDEARRQQVEMLATILTKLDKIEHRIATMEQNTHERSIYFQGLVQGVRSAILSKLDARSDTQSFDLGGLR